MPCVTPLVHIPNAGDVQKHTFSTDYIDSDARKEDAKVKYEDTVTIAADNGHHVAVAKRDIKKGELIEQGIMRLCEGLDASVSNPFVLRLGSDFQLTGTKRPCGCPFLASGVLMFYRMSTDAYNVQLSVRAPVGKGSYEFSAVATQDIAAGTQLVREVIQDLDEERRVRCADAYNMSDTTVDKFLAFRKELDESLAAGVGISRMNCTRTLSASTRG